MLERSISHCSTPSRAAGVAALPCPGRQVAPCGRQHNSSSHITSSSQSVFSWRLASDYKSCLALTGCGRRCATLILRLSCVLAPSRESDVRLQSTQNFSSPLRSSRAHRYLPLLSVSSSWPSRPGTLPVHSDALWYCTCPLYPAVSCSMSACPEDYKKI